MKWLVSSPWQTPGPPNSSLSSDPHRGGLRNKSQKTVCEPPYHVARHTFPPRLCLFQTSLTPPPWGQAEGSTRDKCHVLLEGQSVPAVTKKAASLTVRKGCGWHLALPVGKLDMLLTFLNLSKGHEAHLPSLTSGYEANSALKTL